MSNLGGKRWKTKKKNNKKQKDECGTLEHHNPASNSKNSTKKPIPQNKVIPGLFPNYKREITTTRQRGRL